MNAMMKTAIFAVVLCLAAVVLGEKKKVDPINLNWKAPEPKPLQNWKAAQANPNGGVNLKYEKKPTLYDNGNLKVQGMGGADRNFGGPADGQWNAKAGGRIQYSWGRN